MQKQKLMVCKHNSVKKVRIKYYLVNSGTTFCDINVKKITCVQGLDAKRGPTGRTFYT